MCPTAHHIQSKALQALQTVMPIPGQYQQQAATHTRMDRSTFVCTVCKQAGYSAVYSAQGSTAKVCTLHIAGLSPIHLAVLFVLSALLVLTLTWHIA